MINRAPLFKALIGQSETGGTSREGPTASTRARPAYVAMGLDPPRRASALMQAVDILRDQAKEATALLELSQSKVRRVRSGPADLCEGRADPAIELLAMAAG